MDAVYRGPVCKHAAACLLVEHRVMKKGLFDECPQIEVAQPPKKGKWLLAIFGALKEKRLVEIKKIATTMLALPAPPLRIVDAETQTMTPRVQAAAPSGVAPDQSIVQFANPRMEFLGGAAAQDKAIVLINQSFPSEPIRLIAYTFDYGPLVVAPCAAKENTPRRLIEVVLAKRSTKTGPTKTERVCAPIAECRDRSATFPGKVADASIG